MDTSIPPNVVGSRDLITAGIEELCDLENPEYLDRARIGNAYKNALLPGMTAMAGDKKNCAYRAMVQALFESGYLSRAESDFNLEQLLNHIYGVKMHESIATFERLFDALMEMGHTEHTSERAYNPSGDNYYSAMKFQIKPTVEDVKTRDIVNEMFPKNHTEPEAWRSDIYRKVIVIENQSPTFAVVLDHCIYTGKPTEMHFVLLKQDYNSVNPLDKFINDEFNFKGRWDLNSYANRSKGKPHIIATLDIRMMEAKPIYMPAQIDQVLFNIYSGHDSLIG